MISLQDEIKKFQKLVYNPELAEFVTVDQMFVGGGITMESIIQENNFIVEELKKMNAVFKNFCKLNQKVYAKITEYELSTHSEQARLNAIVTSVDRRLEDTLKKIKQLHEETISHNQKSQTFILEVVDPLKQELALKVDFTTFKTEMMKVMEEEEHVAVSEVEKSEGEGIKQGREGVTNDRAPDSPYPKKKGKLGYEEFYRFRDELDAKLRTQEEQITNLEKTQLETTSAISKSSNQINHLFTEINEHNTSIGKLDTQLHDNFSSLTTSLANLQLQLNNRTNDQAWNSKLDSFNQKQLKPVFSRIEDNLKGNHGKFTQHRQETLSKLKQLQAQSARTKNTINLLQHSLQKLQEQLSATNTQLKQVEQSQENNKQQLNKKLKSAEKNTKSQLQTQKKNREKQIKEVNQKLNTLATTAEENIIKAVNKRFDLQLKTIDKDIRNNANDVKSISSDIGIIDQEIKNIKNLLARKANFTDIVLHVEKKADKEDIQELKHQFNQTSQQFYSKQLNDSINLSRIDKTQYSTRRIPSANKTNHSRNQGPPHTSHQRTEKIDFDSGTKLFMCGMEGRLLDNRKNFSQHSNRRKNLKSSTVIVSDFIV